MTAGTGTCDGCDREGPVQQFEEVILPSGSMVVCPECRYHAEELAERSTADCEGCGSAVTAVDLARTELPDGVELILCPDCQDSVAAGRRPDGASDAGHTADADDTDDAARADARDREDSTAGANGSTASGAAGSTASGAAEPAASGTSGATGNPSPGTAAGSDGDASDAESTASASTEAHAESGDAVTDGATSKPATTRNACDQCGCLFSIELYQVVTVDGRREEFCPDCKDEGLEEGVVSDVELRRAQAYEVLGLAGSADPDDVRQAYLEQVKEVHPDRADGDRAEFMLVQQAYERLRDD